MKRIIKVVTIVAFVLSLSSLSFAATDIAIGTFGSTGQTLHAHDTTATATTALIGKTSTGVGLACSTTRLGYSIMTQHLQGSKAFGTSFDSTSIFSEDVGTVGTALISGNLAGITTADFSSWNEM